HAQPARDGTARLFGTLLDIRVLHEGRADRHELAPSSGEAPRQRERNHPVVVDADAHAKAIELRNRHGVAFERQRRIVVLHIRRRDRFGGETGSNGGPADEGRYCAEIDGLGDVEEVKEEDLPAANLLHQDIDATPYWSSSASASARCAGRLSH